jgi:hypothetical protein
LLHVGLVCGLLSGCDLNSTSAPTASAGVAIQGRVFGGQQPIVGANVYVFAANTTGYGGAGIAASANNASISLLNDVPGSTTLDTSGGATNGDYYVTTGAGGAFSITGDYTCTPNQQVYLYALGGDTGAGNNPVAGQLALLGNCPAADTFATQTPYVVINEVTTIAAAYAFAGFATDATHVSSSGTALAQNGIEFAFANVFNLLLGVDSGVARTTTPQGTGIVPQALINTLADLLAGCVNSTGVLSGPTNPTVCYTLFNNTLSGGTTGTVPSDTATAAINMAHNPGANLNALAALFGTLTANLAFQPTVTSNSNVNDLTLAVQFSGGRINASYGLATEGGSVWITNYGGNSIVGMTNDSFMSSAGLTEGGDLNGPIGIAIDSSRYLWVLNEGSTSNSIGVTKIPPGGGCDVTTCATFISGASGNAAAIDGSGNVWLTTTQISSSIITELSNSGSLIGFFGSIGGISVPYGIAIDGSGDSWITNLSGNISGSIISELNASGSAITGANGYAGGVSGATGIAIDGAGNAWIANGGGNSVSELSQGGSPHAGSPYAVGGLTLAVAIDGAGNAWFRGSNQVYELSSSGANLSGSSGYQSGANTYAFTPPDSEGQTPAIAIDGSGNVWVANGINNSVSELVGVAVPVITPIAAGLPATPTANGTSNLGTRP